ncbi:hypothetical protein [Nocardia miyunensis]|uniref:hypothetical protein n=1 Tax=Nocardia miyunensis TaxID=282684 RepID=UPI00082E1F70|nr:hypothetical protein [Nocardia miyunensis]
MSSENKDEWGVAARAVRDGAAELRGLRTYTEYYRWAETHGLATRSLFRKFKAELLRQLDIDYDQLRVRATGERAATAAAAASEGPHIMLSAAGYGEEDRYAVCGPDGVPAWHGHFHMADRDHPRGDQQAADLGAAKKAVWLAGKTRAAVDADAATLHLTVSRQNVEPAALQRSCADALVLLDLSVALDNAAEDWSRRSGFHHWDADDLAELIIPDGRVR